MSVDSIPRTYVVSVDLLLGQFLHQIIDLVLTQNQVIGENLLVKGAGIRNNHRHVSTNVPQVSQSCGHISISDDLVVAGGHGIINTSGREAGVRKLVPPSHIDDGVRKPQLADLVVDDFFLFGERNTS